MIRITTVGQRRSNLCVAQACKRAAEILAVGVPGQVPRADHRRERRVDRPPQRRVHPPESGTRRGREALGAAETREEHEAQEDERRLR